MSSSKKLLVIDGNALHNWVELFEHRTLADGTPIEVVQASWNELSVVVYGDSGVFRLPPVSGFSQEALMH